VKASEVRLHLTETQFQEMIVARARAQGWLIHHDRGDYRQCIAGDPGFPDLVLVRHQKVIFVEVKSERGVTTAAQQAWLDRLPYLQSFLWRPRDWSKIVEVLA
jgi:hypothetical protein